MENLFDSTQQERYVKKKSTFFFYMKTNESNANFINH